MSTAPRPEIRNDFVSEAKPVGKGTNPTTSPAPCPSRPALRFVSPPSSVPAFDHLLEGPAALKDTLRSGRQLLGKGRQRHSGKAQPQATTVEPLDRLLGGGLFPGQMVELIGRRSSGRFATALQALAAATQRGEAAALVDLGDHLDPRAAQAAGVDLERLLWLRPRRLKEALGGTEMLLATGFSLVVLDLGQPPVAGGRGVEAFWLRLARATRAREAALLVSSPYRMSGTAAAAVLEAQGQRGLWRGHADLLAGLGTRLSLAKVKGFSGGLSGDSAEGASLRRAGAQAAQVWRSPELPPGAPLPGRPDRMPRQQPQRFSSPQPWLARTG